MPAPTPPSHPVSRWEHFEHRADIGVRGYGPSLAEAFAQAAMALTAIITDLSGVRPLQGVDVACTEADDELLFVDWLNRIVYEMAVGGMLFSRFEVAVEAGRLHATIYGEPLDRARHCPAVEIKGATFTELLVERRPDGIWLAQCVVDV
jgi:SHS2 domain-containing protein